MRFLVVLPLIVLCHPAAAAAADCKTIADPAARLTCYDKINPPVATYPIPLPKPSQPIPLATNPDGTRVYTESSGTESGDDDAILSAKMHGICRGC
jgi:hypothetical protein